MVSLRWSGIARNADAIELEEPTADKKVVTMPTSLDALAKEIRETTNAMVNCEAEFEKLARQLAHQQKRMVEHMKALGIRAEVVLPAAVQEGQQ